MKFTVLTLFPEMFEMLSHSILGRAQNDETIVISTINIRDFSDNKHKKVDDAPYGGGAGMVMAIQPIESALSSLNSDAKVIYLSPRGKTLTQEKAIELSRLDALILLCGHYEGVDQRVINTYVHEEISIGDYVLTGGELPAMVLIDTIARLKKGVLGHGESCIEESYYNGLLEYDHYTRPAVYKEMSVPEVLLSGHHLNIEAYRLFESLKITHERRPDLFELWVSRSHDKFETKILKKYLDSLNK